MYKFTCTSFPLYFYSGNPEGDPGGAANSSDHETKVLTSPGTSGTEDSNKVSTVDNPPPQAKQKAQTQVNGPSATQSKSSTLPSKSRKGDSGVKKQSNNAKKLSETAADESKTASRSERSSARSSVKADRPKSLDLSNKIDSERTTSQSGSNKKTFDFKFG